jgi:hypothetical protein
VTYNLVMCTDVSEEPAAYIKRFIYSPGSDIVFVIKMRNVVAMSGIWDIQDVLCTTSRKSSSRQAAQADCAAR